MKAVLIIVLYHTPAREVARLKREIASLRWTGLETVFVDNSQSTRGYAYGVNIGLRKACAGTSNLFIVANPDISLSGLSEDEMLEAGNHFDIWGFAMKQQDTVYYGGEIDRWRMSGGLSRTKPGTRFVPADFVTGSLMAITRKTVESIGYFDESYGMYYEDVDYCYRARQKGLRVGIDSHVQYEHFELSKSNRAKKWYLARNRLRFFLRNATLLQKIRELFRLPKSLWEFVRQSR